MPGTGFSLSPPVAWGIVIPWSPLFQEPDIQGRLHNQGPGEGIKCRRKPGTGAARRQRATVSTSKSACQGRLRGSRETRRHSSTYKELYTPTDLTTSPFSPRIITAEVTKVSKGNWLILRALYEIHMWRSLRSRWGECMLGRWLNGEEDVVLQRVKGQLLALGGSRLPQLLSCLYTYAHTHTLKHE